MFPEDFFQPQVKCIEPAALKIFQESTPLAGNLRYLHVGMPQMTHTKARVDSGVREGDDVSMFYDPMIAKVSAQSGRVDLSAPYSERIMCAQLITWGPDRSSALSAMSAALSRFRIAGVPNNVDFLKTSVCYTTCLMIFDTFLPLYVAWMLKVNTHRRIVRRCVAHEGFVKGGLTTKFLSEHGADLVKKSICSVEPADVALAAGLLCAHERYVFTPRIERSTLTTKKCCAYPEPLRGLRIMGKE
jgi:acetyl/propionyl-CoA carboxylase alpha subunit